MGLSLDSIENCFNIWILYVGIFWQLLCEEYWRRDHWSLQTQGEWEISNFFTEIIELSIGIYSHVLKRFFTGTFLFAENYFKLKTQRRLRIRFDWFLFSEWGALREVKSEMDKMVAQVWQQCLKSVHRVHSDSFKEVRNIINNVLNLEQIRSTWISSTESQSNIRTLPVSFC